MPDREAHLLSPYRPPTSYPVSLNPDEATGWLNGYLQLWHPAALAGLSKPPITSTAYDHDKPGEGFLYAVPTGPYLYQPDDWAERVTAANAVSFNVAADEFETAANFRATNLNPELQTAPHEVVRLFAGLGYAYLVVESLFDAMDHEHLLDVAAFWEDVRQAVELVRQNAGTEAITGKLREAAEKIATARQVLNSNSLRLIDIAILDKDKLDTPLPATRAAGLPLSVIASGEVLTELAERHPDRLAELKAENVDICCGGYTDRDDPLLPTESQFWNLTNGRAAVRNLLGRETDVYARARSAQHLQLPGWLRHAGYKNAVVASFDGARTPVRNASVVNWPAPDGKSVEAFGREPLNAADPLTFFNLVYHLHQAFTQDSSPVVAFKHTGEPPAVGYDALLASAALGDPCGEWIGLTAFLAEISYGDYLGTTSADDFHFDALDDLVTNKKQANPVSGFAEHLRARRRIDTAYALAALYRSLTPEGEADAKLLTELEAAETAMESGSIRAGSVSDGSAPTVAHASGSDQIGDAFAQLLAERVQVRSADNQPGLMVFNPCNFTRRVALELDDFGGPIPVEGPVKAAEFSGRAAKLVVEVPSLGFAWIPRDGTASPPKARLKTAEGTVARNEFLEADFDPVTGALRAVRDGRTRLNRVGMQLVFNPGSTMKCRGVTVTNSGAALGEVTCVGDLVNPHDDVLARFTQRIRAWVGRPVLEVRIELEPVHHPAGYPWHNYFGARFVWRDDRAALFRGVNGANCQTGSTYPTSPDYLETRLGSERTFVFTGGLPFIHKIDSHTADVVLVTEGETARRFDLLLALDREHPMQTAAGWVAPSPVVRTDKGPPHIGPTGWLAHVDLPSLLMTQLRPVRAREGKNRAVAMRLVECAGFGGAADIRFARDPVQAVMIDAEGTVERDIALNEGAIPVDFSAGETFRVQAEWE